MADTLRFIYVVEADSNQTTYPLAYAAAVAGNTMLYHEQIVGSGMGIYHGNFENEMGKGLIHVGGDGENIELNNVETVATTTVWTGNTTFINMAVNPIIDYWYSANNNYTLTFERCIVVCGIIAQHAATLNFYSSFVHAAIIHGRAGSTLNLYNNTLQGGGRNLTALLMLWANQTLNLSNNLFIGDENLEILNTDSFTGTLNAFSNRYNFADASFPGGQDNSVASAASLGVASGLLNSAYMFAPVVRQTLQVDGNKSPNGVALSGKFTKDLQGNDRPDTNAGYAIGCSYKALIPPENDVLTGAGGKYTVYSVNIILDIASGGANGGVDGIVPGKATLSAAAEVWDGAVDFGKFGSLTTPTYQAADEGDVIFGTGQYGGDGTQFTPTYVCPSPSEPTGPTLVITDQETGDSALAVVSNADAGSTNKVYGKSPDADNWTLVATVDANGSEGFGDLSVAEWEFYVLSIAVDTGQAIGTDGIIVQQISDGSDISTNVWEDNIRENGELMIVEENTEEKQNNMSSKSVWSTRSTIWGWLQPTNSNLRIQYQQRQLVVTNKVYIAKEPEASEGDRLKISGVYYLIRGVTNQAGIDNLWRIDVEQVQ